MALVPSSSSPSHVIIQTTENPTENMVHDETDCLHIPSSSILPDVLKNLQNHLMADEGEECHDMGEWETELKTPYANLVSTHDTHIQNNIELSKHHFQESQWSQNEGDQPPRNQMSQTGSQARQLRWSHNTGIIFENLNNKCQSHSILMSKDQNLDGFPPNRKASLSTHLVGKESEILPESSSEAQLLWRPDQDSHLGNNRDYNKRKSDIRPQIQQEEYQTRGNWEEGYHIDDHKKSPQQSIGRRRKISEYDNCGAQENVDRPKNFDDSHHDRNHYSQSTGNLLRTLKYQGTLEMGANKGISVLFSTFLERISTVLKNKILNQNQNDFEYVKKVEITIQKAKYSLVKGFFGGLCVIDYLNQGNVSKEDLIHGGVSFLIPLLKEWTLISSDEITVYASAKHRYFNEELNTPTQIFCRIMNLAEGTDTPYSTLSGLIRQFTRWYNHRKRPLYIIYDEIHFVNECWNINRRRNSIPPPESEGIYDHLEEVLHGSIPKDKKLSKNCATENQSRWGAPKNGKKTNGFTRRRGEEFLIMCGGLGAEIHIFFEEFLQSLIKNFDNVAPKHREALMEQVSKQRSYRNVIYTNPCYITPERMFERLINLTHYQITAMFLSSLKVYHHHQDQFDTLELSLKDGWKFLQGYFWTWMDHLLFYTGDVVCKPGSADWSNPQEVIQYFLTITTGRYPPWSFIRYLCDQWENMVYHRPRCGTYRVHPERQDEAVSTQERQPPDISSEKDMG